MVSPEITQLWTVTCQLALDEDYIQDGPSNVFQLGTGTITTSCRYADITLATVTASELQAVCDLS